MKLKYFTASWCVPCRVFGPIMKEVTDNLDVEMEKLDIDEDDSWRALNVGSVPTVIMLQDGKEVSRIVGARGHADLEGWIKSGGI